MTRFSTILTTVVAIVATPSFAAQVQGGPTDPQIAAIVVTANQVDIDAGMLAKSKAASPDVKSFAQLMITDHTGVNRQAKQLVARLQVTPHNSEASRP